MFYRRSVDDIFALFFPIDHADVFKEYLSSKYLNIIFSMEKEKDDCLRFLDVNIFRENGKFPTSAYRKKTFMGFIQTSNALRLRHAISLIKPLLLFQFVLWFY